MDWPLHFRDNCQIHFSDQSQVDYWSFLNAAGSSAIPPTPAYYHQRPIMEQTLPDMSLMNTTLPSLTPVAVAAAQNTVGPAADYLLPPLSHNHAASQQPFYTSLPQRLGAPAALPPTSQTGETVGVALASVSSFCISFCSVREEFLGIALEGIRSSTVMLNHSFRSMKIMEQRPHTDGCHQWRFRPMVRLRLRYRRTTAI